MCIYISIYIYGERERVYSVVGPGCNGEQGADIDMKALRQQTSSLEARFKMLDLEENISELPGITWNLLQIYFSDYKAVGRLQRP